MAKRKCWLFGREDFGQPCSGCRDAAEKTLRSLSNDIAPVRTAHEFPEPDALFPAPMFNDQNNKVGKRGQDSTARIERVSDEIQSRVTSREEDVLCSQHPQDDEPGREPSRRRLIEYRLDEPDVELVRRDAGRRFGQVDEGHTCWPRKSLLSDAVSSPRFCRSLAVTGPPRAVIRSLRLVQATARSDSSLWCAGGGVYKLFVDERACTTAAGELRTAHCQPQKASPWRRSKRLFANLKSTLRGLYRMRNER